MPTLMVSTLQLMQRDLSKMPQDSGMRGGNASANLVVVLNLVTMLITVILVLLFVVVESKLVLGIPSVIAGLLLEQ